MKILLRNHDEGQYVWKTAKYNYGDFYVDGYQMKQTNIVSIINDNRKKYVQCSSCGKVHRRGDPHFEAHRANAIKPETCFNCSHLCAEDRCTYNRKFVVNPDGSFSEIMESSIRLTCGRTGAWTYHDIDSERAINGCKKRQCANATEMEISDFFTKYHGAFEDIITIDKLLDDGYNVGIAIGSEASYDVEWGEDYTICAIINTIGIVDRLAVWFEGDKYEVYYSKRYDKLFTNSRDRKYIDFNPIGMFNETMNEIKKAIRILYN